MWYAGGTITLACFAAYGMWSGAWSFAAVMALIGLVYFLLRKTPTYLRKVTILQEGIDMNGILLRWDDCRSFWVIRTPQWNELHVRRKFGMPRVLSVQTGRIDPMQIRALLSQFLPEEADRHEHLVDRIIRICKL